jgi:hypothetical protein
MLNPTRKKQLLKLKIVLIPNLFYYRMYKTLCALFFTGFLIALECSKVQSQLAENETLTDRKEKGIK